jgi:GNAT superfamily N-acetyltransferase
MEIRTLVGIERRKVADFLDAWPLAGGWSAGDRFRRHAEFDPTWSDENVFVAIDQGEILGTVSILPRRLQILGHAIPAGGLGSLYTAPGARGRGIGSELLERACEAMRSRGLELSVVFPVGPLATPAFFEKRGWYSWGGQQTILRRDESAPLPSRSRADEEAKDQVLLEAVLPGDVRALQSVKSIHAAYAASRSGSVVRDDALWEACFALTQSPLEEFWIARRGGLAVAYARASIVEDVLTITELGRFEDGGGALARLIGSLLEPREHDPLIPSPAKASDARSPRKTSIGADLSDTTESMEATDGGAEASSIRGAKLIPIRPDKNESPPITLTSAELRSFAVLPTFDDIGLTIALEHRGIRSHPMDDARAGFRCVNLIGLASRLGVDLLPGEDGPKFLHRILPPDAMVFWPADRF